MLGKKKRDFKDSDTGKMIYLLEEELVDKPYQWNSYVCTPCENCNNCFCVCCCPLIAIYDIIRHGLNIRGCFACLLCCLLTPVSWPIFTIISRLRIRRFHNLEGNIISDVLCLVCCPFVMCQLRNEILFLRKIGLWRTKSKPKLDGESNEEGDMQEDSLEFDDNIVCERCVKINNIYKYFCSDAKFISYARSHHLMSDINPETAMMYYGRIRREYDLHIINSSLTSNSNSSTSSKLNAEDKAENAETNININFSCENISQIRMNRE